MCITDGKQFNFMHTLRDITSQVFRFVTLTEAQKWWCEVRQNFSVSVAIHCVSCRKEFHTLSISVSLLKSFCFDTVLNIRTSSKKAQNVYQFCRHLQAICVHAAEADAIQSSPSSLLCSEHFLLLVLCLLWL